MRIQRNDPNATEVIDRLIEQNQQIEKQNQERERQNRQLEKQRRALMEQIKALRGQVAQIANGNQQVSEAGSAKTVAGQKTQPAGQAFTQKRIQVMIRPDIQRLRRGIQPFFEHSIPGAGLRSGEANTAN